MNYVKRTSKRENTIENHALPPVHVQWKEENQCKNESLFSAWGEGEKEVPYIFFHNFTACQWKLPAVGCHRHLERRIYEKFVSRYFILPPYIGVASVASQSAECVSCHMTQKANPVTLTL